MRVLFLIRNYGATDGASTALREMIDENDALSSYTIASRWVREPDPSHHVVQVNSEKQLQHILESQDFDLVHYFKVSGYDLLPWVLTAMRKVSKQLPIVTTVCQRPSYPGLLIAPWEITHSARMVFIDRSAMNDPMYSFLNPEGKEQIYFGCSESIVKLTQAILKSQKPHEGVIFGRGSTLSKCPADMIQTYDSIQVTGKKFVIAGVLPESWVGATASQRADIEVVPAQPMEQWLETCARFDIFLYQLPEDSHASIDGTLAHAMLLEKPVVYCGAPAPKERFQSGVNGIVCDTPQEMAQAAQALALNPERCKAMGQAARHSTLEQLSMRQTVERYNRLYEEVLRHPQEQPMKVPQKYSRYFTRHSLKQLVTTRYLSGSCIERCYRRLHPL